MESKPTLEERLEKIRIQLIREKPFFGYIIPKLKFHRDEYIPTAAIDAYGNVYYSPKFLGKYSDSQISSIICHELLHYVLKHHVRSSDYEYQTLANIAQDLVINDILIYHEKMDFLPVVDTLNYSSPKTKNKSSTPKGLGTSKDGIFTVILSNGQKRYIQVRDKSWEYVYDCLQSIEVENNSINQPNMKVNKSPNKGGGDGHGGSQTESDEPDDNGQPDDDSTDTDNEFGTGSGINENADENHQNDGMASKKSDNNTPNSSLGDSFDQHIWSDLSDEEEKQISSEINDLLAEAKTFDDKTCNRNPDGGSWMNRILDESLHPQLDWRKHLRKVIQNCIPHDFTYSKPSKRSYSSGYYIPNTTKELVNVTLAIDVSGSISDTEFAKFIAEFKGIMNSKPSVKIRTLFWSTEVDKDNDVVFTRSDLCKLSDKLPKIHTTGGTTMSCVNEYLTSLKNDKNKSALETMIYLTDGYIEPNPKLYEKTKNNIFVITATGSAEVFENLHTGPILRLSNRKRR